MPPAGGVGRLGGGDQVVIDQRPDRRRQIIGVLELTGDRSVALDHPVEHASRPARCPVASVHHRQVGGTGVAPRKSVAPKGHGEANRSVTTRLYSAWFTCPGWPGGVNGGRQPTEPLHKIGIVFEADDQ